jgi:hypothetical protein
VESQRATSPIFFIRADRPNAQVWSYKKDIL